jgi:hypothetical protein
MMRSIFVASVLCVACTHHQQIPLDAVTTTSATITPDRGARTLETNVPEDQTVASMPSPLPSYAQDDARIAAAVAAYDDAAVARAKFAMGRAKDSRVHDYAQLVYDRHHEAKMRLSNSNAVPDTVEPPAGLVDAHAQVGLDFDRDYVETESRAQSELLQLLDHTTPETKTLELRKRLMDLRPQVADLWLRGYELQMILAAP